MTQEISAIGMPAIHMSGPPQPIMNGEVTSIMPGMSGALNRPSSRMPEKSNSPAMPPMMNMASTAHRKL